jgi:Cu2+-exporting ATPase
VNDAAALSAASVGIAVHGGAEASLAAASVFTTRGGIGPIVELVRAARRTLSVIRRGVIFSLVYNLAAVGLALAGLLSPLLAALLMPLSSLAVISNAYRSRTFPR